MKNTKIAKPQVNLVQTLKDIVDHASQADNGSDANALGIIKYLAEEALKSTRSAADQIEYEPEPRGTLICKVDSGELKIVKEIKPKVKSKTPSPSTVHSTVPSTPPFSWMAKVQRQVTQDLTFMVTGKDYQEATEQAMRIAPDLNFDLNFAGAEKDADYTVIGLKAILVEKE